MEPYVQGPIYLSAIIFRKIYAADGSPWGKSLDFIINADMVLPEITAMLCRPYGSRRHTFIIDRENIELLTPEEIRLKADAPMRAAGAAYENGVSASQIFLRDFLLDKQIVDVFGAKVERVNDLVFINVDGHLKLTQVDVGLRGILRRLGFERPVVRFLQWFFDYTLSDAYIAWNYVQPLADPDRLKLQVSQNKLAQLHPAELADIIEDMDIHERAAVMQAMDEEVIADAMEEMDPKVQVAIIRGLEPEKAADIIEEMSPDEAADLIADLPSQTAEDILEEMELEAQQKVIGLLAHDEDEAGGLMTTQFIALPPDKTIVDALGLIRRHADNVDVLYYIYIVDTEGLLLGVVSLRELLSHEIFTPLERIMTDRLVTVKITDGVHMLADVFGKYGFRAIPVTDEENKLMGVVRFRAILEALAPYLGR